MADLPQPDAVYDTTCPHCGRDFQGRVLAGGTTRGFKCPHCKLFVPFERARTSADAEG